MKICKEKKNSNSNVLYSFYYTYKEETLKSKCEMQITTYTYLFRHSIILILYLSISWEFKIIKQKIQFFLLLILHKKYILLLEKIIKKIIHFSTLQCLSIRIVFIIRLIRPKYIIWINNYKNFIIIK